jgi:hypothetical protein
MTRSLTKLIHGKKSARLSQFGEDVSVEHRGQIEERRSQALAKTLTIVDLRVALVASLLGILLWSSACGDSPATEDATAEQPTAEATAPAPDPEFVDFDPANFSNSTVIDNDWSPMIPGTQWVYEGVSIEEGVRIPHRIEFTVTDLTKEIQGVRTVVAWIVDVSDGVIAEKEIAFYAQDDDGNVWYLGEHPEEYKDGRFHLAPTWIAGVEESLPGVKMWAEPQVGIPSYFQGWGPTVEWSDFGTIDARGERNCVAVGCYDDTLVIAESSLDEIGIYQLKYYARGVGEIRVGWRGEQETPEELELVQHKQLDPEALAAIRAETLALEEHAYQVSKEYSFTKPAQ